MLSSNVHLPVSEIDIADFKRHELFPSQGPIVGEKQHHLIAKPFFFEAAQEALPLLIGGKPRELVVMGKKPSVTDAAKGFARHVMASAHRIILAELLFDEGITEQA